MIDSTFICQTFNTYVGADACVLTSYSIPSVCTINNMYYSYVYICKNHSLHHPKHMKSYNQNQRTLNRIHSFIIILSNREAKKAPKYSNDDDDDADDDDDDECVFFLFI